MPTQYLERLLIGIPDGSKSAITTWWVNNIDPNGANTFSVGLSATGTLPATHWVACTALTRVQLRRVLVRLATLAGLTPPAGWEGWTKAQRLQWILDHRAAIRQATGVRIWRCDNDGAWDQFSDLIAAAGLQVIQTEQP